jgi:hypothetical protein
MSLSISSLLSADFEIFAIYEQKVQNVAEIWTPVEEILLRKVSPFK